LLSLTCEQLNYDENDYFFALEMCSTKVILNTNDETAIMDAQFHTDLELHRKKPMYIELTNATNAGMSVEIEMTKKTKQSTTTTNQDEETIKITVNQVNETMEAFAKGVRTNDQMIQLDGIDINLLDIERIENYLKNACPLRLTFNTNRLTTDKNPIINQFDDDLSSMICPPPPPLTNTELDKSIIDSLIVPAPTGFTTSAPISSAQLAKSKSIRMKRSDGKMCLKKFNSQCDQQIDSLIQNCQQVNNLCRSNTTIKSGLNQPLTNADKLYRVISELIETEKNYIVDIKSLLNLYLKPLKQKQNELLIDSETKIILSNLLDNVSDIYLFQKTFTKTLEKCIGFERIDDLKVLKSVYEFKACLVSISNVFLQYSSQFRIYSAFCSNHSKFQTKLANNNSDSFKKFLLQQNQSGEHSTSIESYLIKPIQRLLKYPLLLKQMTEFIDIDSNEFYQLTDAFKSMQLVAQQINENQKIFDEYGRHFDCLMKDNSNVNLTPNHLLLNGKLDWLNIYDQADNIKKKKLMFYETFCFIFDVGLVVISLEEDEKEQLNHLSTTSLLIGNKSKNKLSKVYPKFIKFLPFVEMKIKNGIDNCWDIIYDRQDKSEIYSFCSRYI
jgi:T-lymphoma invasion and metastasis-inducing protein 2